MSGNIPIQGQKDWRQNYCYYVKTKIQRAKSNLNLKSNLKFLALIVHTPMLENFEFFGES